MKNTIILLLTLFFIFTSCTAPVREQIDSHVISKTLVLSSIGQKKFADNITSKEIYIKLTETSKFKGDVIGFGGCNNIYGTYEDVNGAPKFSLGTTKKYCDDKSTLENEMLEILKNLDFVQFVDVHGKEKYNYATFWSESLRKGADFIIIE
jgi:heat shock protein HslJ